MATRSFTTFRLNNQLFGLDILLVREINRQLDVSMVPHAPDYVRGLINLRGQIVTVIDLKKRLGFGESDLSNLTHNVILKTDSELIAISQEEDRDDLKSASDKVGLLVDDIGDVITVEEAEIEAPPANLGQIDGKYLSGVIKLEKNLVAVLSASHVLTDS